jgi:hypothetical protein
MAEPIGVYIHAGAALGPCLDTCAEERIVLTADPSPAELKGLTRKVVGMPLRQASHLIELAAIGSQLCLKRLPWPAPENSAVYVGTGLAEVRKTQAVFGQVMPPGPGMASPFDFINAANNMAAFYTAKLANFRARNLTITQEEFSFEWALQLALADLRAGSYHQALVGGMDESSQPRASHLRRFQLRDGQVMGEGSGWLYLGTRREHARGELLTVRHVARGSNAISLLEDAVQAWRQHGEPVVLLPGFRLERSETAGLATALPDLETRDYLAHCGCFHTAAAFGIGALFDHPWSKPTLVVHINRDGADGMVLVALRMFASNESASDRVTP